MNPLVTEARSRTLLPEMAAEIERLEAELSTEREKSRIMRPIVLDGQSAENFCHVVELSELREESQRLQSELDALKTDIEAGRLIRIPCREFFDSAGGTVWLVWGGEATEMVHCGADIDAEGKPFATLVCEDKIFPYRDGDAGHDTEMSDWCTNTKYVLADEYAQTVFTTEEAARAALEGEAHG